MWCLLLPVLVLSHGRLVTPIPRSGGGNPSGTENEPVPSQNDVKWVCRHELTPASLTLTPGDSLTLEWAFSAAHKGDCAVYLSYDSGEDRATQKFFKIANLFDCRSSNGTPVTITLPDWLPQGQATLRWDWYALHNWPSVEFYSQCVDVNIAGSNAPNSDIFTYALINPAVYPATADEGVGYRNPNPGGGAQFMTGPPCALGYTGNDCELTACGTQGFVDVMGVMPSEKSKASSRPLLALPTMNPSHGRRLLQSACQDIKDDCAAQTWDICADSWWLSQCQQTCGACTGGDPDSTSIETTVNPACEAYNSGITDSTNGETPTTTTTTTTTTADPLEEVTGFGTFIEGASVNSAGQVFAVHFRGDSSDNNAAHNTIGVVDPDTGASSLFYTGEADAIYNGIEWAGSDMYLADVGQNKVRKVNTETMEAVDFCTGLGAGVPNDLVRTSQGRLYLSGQDWGTSTGALWSCTAGGEALLVEGGMARTNGIALSADEQTLFLTEAVGSPVSSPTGTQVIWKYTGPQPDGSFATKEKFFDFATDMATPEANVDSDGMTTDSAGNLYVTRNGLGKVTVVSAAGSWVRDIALTKTTFPTNLARTAAGDLYAVGRCGDAPWGTGDGCVEFLHQAAVVEPDSSAVGFSLAALTLCMALFL